MHGVTMKFNEDKKQIISQTQLMFFLVATCFG